MIKDRIGDWLISALIFLSCFGVAGCNTTQYSGPDKAENGWIAIGPDNLEQICGMQWILKEMIKGGKVISLEKEVPYVEFTPEGKLAGFASINRFFGSLSFDKEGGVKISPMGTTMMAGPDPLMKQEQAFLNLFQKAETLSLDGIYLTVAHQGGQDRLVFFVPVH
jgi:heat shock protein HslJ